MAVLLHVSFAIFLFFHKKGPEKADGLKVEPEKTVQELLSIKSPLQTEPHISRSLSVKSAPTSPFPSVALVEQGVRAPPLVTPSLRPVEAADAESFFPEAVTPLHARLRDGMRQARLPAPFPQTTGDTVSKATTPSQPAEVRIAPLKSAAASLAFPSPPSMSPEEKHLEAFFAPQPPERILSEMAERLLESLEPVGIHPRAQIRADNFTYKDLGLESAGTRKLASMMRNEISKLDRVEILSPAEISKTPQAVLEGQLWDFPGGLEVKLQLVEFPSGRVLSSSRARIESDQLPGEIDFEPRAGKNRDIIQRIAALMQRFFPQGGDFQLGVWPDKGIDAVYHGGERLMLNILSETNAYLQVDYYRIDGKVVHLLPNPGDTNHALRGKPLVVGGPESSYEFVVEAPFGEEVLVVIARKEPFAALAQDMVEPAGPYIDRLAEELQRHGEQRRAAGRHLIIVTRESTP